MRPGKAIAAVLVLIVLMGSDALAGVSECRAALDSYSDARRQISISLQQYTSCLRLNDPHEDCSLEFQMLQFDQEDLEDAVQSYQLDCA